MSEPKGMSDRGLLNADELGIGYGGKKRDHWVAKGLNLELPAGCLVCLLGPNGAGKSTLLRTLAGMQPPLAGGVEIGGESFATLSSRERARRVSVVLTDTLPTGMLTAYALVALGRHPYSGWLGRLTAKDHERIEWAIQAVGAEDLAGRQVYELSDGERQKVSVARALAQEARVMLLDEPTAYLDLPRRVELMGLLRELAHRESMGILLSTHDLDVALRFADRLWLMEADGSVLEGVPEDLALSGDFARIFASERVDWDVELGSFRAHREVCLKVRIEGEGSGVLWTRRALARLGFGESKVGGTEAFLIEVNRSESGWKWRVQRGDDSIEFFSIGSWVAWIQSKDWSIGKEQ